MMTSPRQGPDAFPSAAPQTQLAACNSSSEDLRIGSCDPPESALVVAPFSLEGHSTWSLEDRPHGRMGGARSTEPSACGSIIADSVSIGRRGRSVAFSTNSKSADNGSTSVFMGTGMANDMNVPSGCFRSCPVKMSAGSDPCDMAGRPGDGRGFNSYSQAAIESGLLETPPPWQSWRERQQQQLPCAGAAVAAILTEIRDRRRGYRLRDLRGSPLMSFLTLWHTYGIWLSACIFLTTAANVLLSWYIQWYRQSRDSNAGPLLNFPIGPFFAIFLRSWTLVCLVGDISRFCFLLTLEAWSCDAFIVYRCAICGRAAPIVEQVSTGLSSEWPSEVSKRPVPWLDLLFQILLYGSFDVAPFVYGLFTYKRTASLMKASVAATTMVSGAACIHTLLFFIAWNVTDIIQKVIAFVQAWKGSSTLTPRQYAGERLSDFHWAGTFGDVQLEKLEAERGLSLCVGEGPVPDAMVARVSSDGVSATASFDWGRSEPSASARSSIRRYSLPISKVCSEDATAPVRRAAAIHPWARPIWAAAESPGGLVNERDPPGDADRFNLCVLVCGSYHAVRQELLSVITLVAASLIGLSLDRKWLILVGLAVSLFFGLRRTRFLQQKRRSRQWRCPIGWGGNSWRLWGLQAWGERYCSLTYEMQTLGHFNFGVVVVLQCALFAVLSNGNGIIVCLHILLAIACRQCTLFIERPWGWFISLLEALSSAFVVSMLNHFEGRRWGLLTFLMSMMRQFGLARHNQKGYRVERLVTLLLSVVLVIVVAVTVITVSLDNGESSETALCDPARPPCSYIDVPYRPPARISGVACQNQFSLGAGDASLSLGEFSLFSALSYEPDETMQNALQHYFPTWRLSYSRRHSTVDKKGTDWTTFFEFSDASNLTSIIAIRGTSSMLDVLDDINIWAPALIMQGFSVFGPTLPAAVAVACSVLSNRIYGEKMQKQYFSELLDYVRSRMRAEPQRRFYLTGHSLGGGLAKLVAAAVDSERHKPETGLLQPGLFVDVKSPKPHLQAVTFMAPGVAITSFVVFGRYLPGELRATGLTVVPDNDVVSLVDRQSGTVVPLDCPESPVTCHRVYQAVCTILDQCGSGRKDGEPPLSLPCGICKAHPCPTPVSASLEQQPGALSLPKSQFRA